MDTRMLDAATAPNDKEPSFSTDNPQTTPPEEQLAAQGVKEDDKQKFVDIITAYRTQWAPDRLMRFANWQKNGMYYRGQQIIEWDYQSNTYIDVIAWFRQEGKAAAGQEIGAEKYINNITQMLGTGFVGTMSRGIPPTVIRPENAQILADVTTAKAAQDAIAIIERMNHIREMVREENTLLYLYGVYFKYCRFVLDGNAYGWDEDPMYGEIQVQKPDRMRCASCGTETPLASLSQQQDPPCPGCQQPLGPGNFWPAESSTQIGFKGMKKSPKGMVRWSVHGPMEIDMDPQAKSLCDTPLLVFDQEIDIGTAKTTFIANWDKITPGAQSPTSPNADYERLRRNDNYSYGWAYTSDVENQRPTYSQAWLKPEAFARLDDQDFWERMSAIYPDGCKVSMIGNDVVEIRPAVLIKEWSACKLHQTFGMYSPSIADNVVPFNERFNDTMQRIDDHIQRCSAGVILGDASRLDRKQLSGKVMDSGVINFVKTIMGGQKVALSDMLHQFQFQLDQNIMEYPNMLLNFAQLISGVTPQTFGGGTQEGIETAKGQAQALSTAQGRLNIFFDNEKEEHSVASQNAIECLQANMTEDIYDVIQEQGSEFRNQYVHLSEMQGRVKVYPDLDQGLPQSPEEIRETMKDLVKQAAEGSDIAKEVLNEVPNQMQAMAALGTPDMVIPGYAQQAKTEQDINTLMSKPSVQVTDPQTGEVSMQLPAMPEMDATDYDILYKTVKLFKQKNADYKQKNPQGWKQLTAYHELAKNMEMQEAIEKTKRMQQVHQAGAPPSPESNPAVHQAQQLLLQDAADSVSNLVRISHLPPLGQNGSEASQTSASQGIVKAALEIAKMQAA
jgi:hypothetical protein